jgi:hypothetical protein
VKERTIEIGLLDSFRLACYVASLMVNRERERKREEERARLRVCVIGSVSEGEDQRDWSLGEFPPRL